MKRLYKIHTGKYLAPEVQCLQVQGIDGNEVVMQSGSRTTYKSNTVEHHLSRLEALQSLDRHYEAKLRRTHHALSCQTQEAQKVREALEELR